MRQQLALDADLCEIHQLDFSPTGTAAGQGAGNYSFISKKNSVHNKGSGNQGYQKNGNIQHHPYTTSPAQQPMSQKSLVIEENLNMPRMYTTNIDHKISKSCNNQNQHRAQVLIDWVNSFNDPYCLLVSSLQDLIDGIALCHLVGQIACSTEDQDKIKQLVYYEATSETSSAVNELALQNVDLAINILKSSNLPLTQDIQSLQPEDVFSGGFNSAALLIFLEALKSISDMITFGSKPHLAPQSSSAQAGFTPHYTSTQSIQVDEGLKKAGKISQDQLTHQQHHPAATALITPRQQIQAPNSERQVQSAGLLREQSENMSQKNRPINYDEGGAPEVKRFDQSLNNISPIGASRIKDNKNRDKSPLQESAISNSKHVNIPPVNVQEAIRQSQEKLQDLEEIQLAQEITQLDISYQRVKQSAQQQRLQQSASSTSRRKRSAQKQKTSSQEQKERLRQRQLEASDYENVIKNTQNIMNKQRTIIDHQSSTFEAKQLQFSERLAAAAGAGDNSSANYCLGGGRITPEDGNTSVQRSIRFKDPQPNTSLTERHAFKNAPTGLDMGEDIMSEMQVLQIQPEQRDFSGRRGSGSAKRAMMFTKEIQIDPVETRTKQKLLEWLSSEVNLVKYNHRLLEDLPLYCKNGVFLCDLADRLSGRTNTLKGVDRNPKNVTHILNNFNRVLDYLRGFPRFCPRYLWAHRHLMDGNADVVWGLLDDMWHWHSNKISPFDPSHERNLAKLEASKSPDRTLSPPRITNNTSAGAQQDKHRFSIRAALPPKIGTTQKRINEQSRNQAPQTSHSFNHVKRTPMKQQITAQNDCPSPTLARERSYSNIHQQSPTKQQLQKTPQKSAMKSSSVTGEVLSHNQSQAQNNGPRSHSNPQASGQISARQKVGGSQGRRKDVSGCQSPIAKDKSGNLYYLTASGEECYQPPHLNDDRNAHSLFSTAKISATKLHEHIEITNEIEGEIRNWLFTLKFSPYLSKEFEHRDICNDPFSNGWLFAELFSHLEKITLFKVIQQPRTIAESRENLTKVLNVIRQRRRDFPLRLLNDQSIEKILKRDRQTIYSILYYLKLAYPENPSNQTAQIFRPQVPDTVQAQNLQLPYSPGELKLLEVSILNWLRQLGLLSKLYGSTFEVESLIQIQKDLSNGILLAELVSQIFNLKITGIFKDPKIEATGISNIRKPLEILRRQSKMSQKFTWTEKEIYEGRLPVIIGLLEDLHRCFDGLPPRKRGLNYFSDGPYLGETLYGPQHEKVQQPRPEVNQPASQPQNNILQSSKLDVAQTNKSQFDELLGDKNKFQEIPSLFQNRKQPLIPDENSRRLLGTISPPPPSLPQQSNIDQSRLDRPLQGLDKGATSSTNGPLLSDPIRQPNFAQFLNLKIKREQKDFSPISNKEVKLNYLRPSLLSVSRVHQSPSVKFSDLPQLQQDILSSQKKELQAQYPVPPTRSPLNINNRGGQSFEFDLMRNNSNLKKPHQISIADYENEEHNLNRHAYNMEEKQKILEWLRGMPNLHLPHGFNLDVDPVIFFKDGILLSELVGELEGFRVENIHNNPKSSASQLQNIRKSLQVLKKKNQVPLYLLYSEEEIHNGNGEIIFQLLKSLRSAYRSKVRLSSTSIGKKGQRTLKQE